MISRQTLFLIAPLLLLPFVSAVPKQDAGKSSINLSKWSLQLPTGKAGRPDSKSSGELTKGFSNEYFRTGSDGQIVMIVDPKKSCVKTKNSKHCRTELRESSPKSWDPKSAKNTLTATLAVISADDSGHGTVIGQIHISEEVSVRPVCELYYNSKGDLSFGVEQTIKGGNQIVKPLGVTVAPGKKFSYTISYARGELEVTVKGKKKKFGTYKLNSPRSYFKVGNYNQGHSRSEVHFYKIETAH